MYAKNGIAGLIPLNNNVYENGANTLEFGTEVVDGNTYGTYAIKTNGTVLDSQVGNYACYNRRLIWGEETATISEDYSTITLSDGTVYTLKQQ